MFWCNDYALHDICAHAVSIVLQYVEVFIFVPFRLLWTTYCEPLEDVSREVMSLIIAVIEFFAMYVLLLIIQSALVAWSVEKSSFSTITLIIRVFRFLAAASFQQKIDSL